MNKALLAGVAILSVPSLVAAGMLELNNDPEFVKETGGVIELPSTGTVFLFANATQEEIEYGSVVDVMTEQCQIPIVCEKVTGGKDVAPYASARRLFETGRFGAIAYIYEGGAEDPVLTAYPENRLTILNVTPLKRDASPEKFTARVQKELWRSLCFAAGGATSGVQMCVMNTVLCLEDLDNLACAMASPPATGGVAGSARRFGFKEINQMTYYEALKDGHVIAPTNDIQKAVYQRVLKEREEAAKGPSKPLKIKYDKKLGR